MLFLTYEMVRKLSLVPVQTFYDSVSVQLMSLSSRDEMYLCTTKNGFVASTIFCLSMKRFVTVIHPKDDMSSHELHFRFVAKTNLNSTTHNPWTFSGF